MIFLDEQLDPGDSDPSPVVLNRPGVVGVPRVGVRTAHRIESPRGSGVTLDQGLVIVGVRDELVHIVYPGEEVRPA